MRILKPQLTWDLGWKIEKWCLPKGLSLVRRSATWRKDKENPLVYYQINSNDRPSYYISEEIFNILLRLAISQKTKASHD